MDVEPSPATRLTIFVDGPATANELPMEADGVAGGKRQESGGASVKVRLRELLAH